MSRPVGPSVLLGALFCLIIGFNLAEGVRWDTYRPTLADTDGCPCVGSNKRIINVLDLNLRDNLRHCPYRRVECVKAVAQLILDYEVDVALFQEVNTTKSPNILEAVVFRLNQTAPKMYTVIPKTGIITRLKVAHVDEFDGPERASGALLNIAPGWYSFFYSLHLTAVPYGPHLLRDHQRVSSVILTANAVQLTDTKRFLTRVFELAEKLDKTHGNRGAPNTVPSISNGDAVPDPFFKPDLKGKGSLRGNHPIVIGGDFNIPSHLDHDIRTATAANYTAKRGLPVIAELEWPVTKYLSDNGYTDAYREVYPDPVVHPGFTWPTTLARGAIHDRVDYIFYRSNSPIYPDSEPKCVIETVEASRINPYVKSVDGSSQDLFSDHRAVFSRLRFTWPQPEQPEPTIPKRAKS